MNIHEYMHVHVHGTHANSLTILYYFQAGFTVNSLWAWVWSSILRSLLTSLDSCVIRLLRNAGVLRSLGDGGGVAPSRASRSLRGEGRERRGGEGRGGVEIIMCQFQLRSSFL